MVDREFTDARADRGRYCRRQTDPSVEVSPCESRDPRRLLTRAPGPRADVRGRAGPDVGASTSCLSGPRRSDRALAREPDRFRVRGSRSSTASAPIEGVHDPGLVAFLADGVGAGPGRAGAGRGLPGHLRPPRHPGGHGRRPPAPSRRGRPPRLLVLRDDDPARRGHLRGGPGRRRRGADGGRPGARRRHAARTGCAARPGHHAPRAAYGGYCYFNNAAIVAHHVARSHRARGSPSSTSTTTTATARSRSSTSATTSSTCRSTATRTGPTPTSPATPTSAAAAGAWARRSTCPSRRAPTTPRTWPR